MRKLLLLLVPLVLLVFASPARTVEEFQLIPAVVDDCTASSAYTCSYAGNAVQVSGTHPTNTNDVHGASFHFKPDNLPSGYTYTDNYPNYGIYGYRYRVSSFLSEGQAALWTHRLYDGGSPYNEFQTDTSAVPISILDQIVCAHWENSLAQVNFDGQCDVLIDIGDNTYVPAFGSDAFNFGYYYYAASHSVDLQVYDIQFVVYADYAPTPTPTLTPSPTPEPDGYPYYCYYEEGEETVQYDANFVENGSFEDNAAGLPAGFYYPGVSLPTYLDNAPETAYHGDDSIMAYYDTQLTTVCRDIFLPPQNHDYRMAVASRTRFENGTAVERNVRLSWNALTKGYFNPLIVSGGLSSCELIGDPISGEYWDCPYGEFESNIISTGGGGITVCLEVEKEQSDTTQLVGLDLFAVYPSDSGGGLVCPPDPSFFEDNQPTPTPSPTSTPAAWVTPIDFSGTPTPLATIPNPIGITPLPTECLGWDERGIELDGTPYAIPAFQLCIEPNNFEFDQTYSQAGTGVDVLAIMLGIVPVVLALAFLVFVRER